MSNKLRLCLVAAIGAAAGFVSPELAVVLNKLMVLFTPPLV